LRRIAGSGTALPRAGLRTASRAPGFSGPSWLGTAPARAGAGDAGKAPPGESSLKGPGCAVPLGGALLGKAPQRPSRRVSWTRPSRHGPAIPARPSGTTGRRGHPRAHRNDPILFEPLGYASARRPRRGAASPLGTSSAPVHRTHARPARRRGRTPAQNGMSSSMSELPPPPLRPPP